jgi:effector-binding domain-containing protein
MAGLLDVQVRIQEPLPVRYDSTLVPRLLCNPGIGIAGPGVAHYEDADGDTGAIQVHAALPIAAQPGPGHDFEVARLGEIPHAATLIHHGSMDDVIASIQALARWIDASDYQSLGYARELTLKLGDNMDDRVTELQDQSRRNRPPDNEESPMDVAPEITQRAAQPYAGISAWVTMAAVGSVADRIPEIFGWLGARRIAPAGPPFFRYHVIDMSRQLLVEAGVPVAAAIDDDGDIRGGTLPAGRFAVMTYTGAPATMVAATAALLDWAEANGLAWDVEHTDEGDKWGCRAEFYLTDPAEQPDTTKWQTQLAFRLAD